jgi:hypothetical protein
MQLDAILGDESTLRSDSLATAARAPEHMRSAFAAKLATVALDAAEALATAEEAGEGTDAYATRLGRACSALSLLGVGTAKTCLLRIADEGTRVVKTTLAQSLRSTETTAARAVLVYLLSDDDAQADAIGAIGAAPWPEVLPSLIEIAEGDDRAVRLSLKAIARCGATGGPKERNAAADFLIEQLDDDVAVSSAVDALLRFGTGFPGVLERAKLLAREPGLRQVGGLCLLAACGAAEASLLELAHAATKPDEAEARAFLGPLLRDGDARVRHAASLTLRVLGLG